MKNVFIAYLKHFNYYYQARHTVNESWRSVQVIKSRTAGPYLCSPAGPIFPAVWERGMGAYKQRGIWDPGGERSGVRSESAPDGKAVYSLLTASTINESALSRCLSAVTITPLRNQIIIFLVTFTLTLW